MTGHHPSDETLARYAAGTLEAGPALVVAAHLESCPACRRHVALFEKVGGVLLDEIEPEAMAADALDRALARIERPRQPAREVSVSNPVRPPLPAGTVLPKALDGCEIGRWRWAGPGVRWSRVTVPGDGRSSAMLMHIGPGRKMPHHGHSGSEYTLVLKGSFSDSTGQYRAGDLCENDADIEHQPVVDDGDCVCLIAMDGKLRFDGLITRLLQPFIGI